MIIGGLIGPLAFTTPYQIPLAAGIGWIGYALIRAPGSRSLMPAEGDLAHSPVHWA